MPTTPKANYLHGDRRGHRPLFHRSRRGTVAGHGRTGKLAQSAVDSALRRRSFFPGGRRNRHLDALPRQRCRRTADRCAPLVAPLTVSDRGRDLLLLRRDRELGRVRTGRAAVFRNGHDRQRDDRRCGRSHGLRHRRGHDLARHRRGDRPQVSANCSTKTHRARARPEARRVHVTA
jgi:hypothetical protein